MSNYKGIKGFQIQTRTEDPTPYAQALADNPYAGTWASGGNMNHARKRNPGAGTQTSSVVAGGDDGGSTPSFTEVEEYNGTSWTEIAEINEGNSRQSCAGANAEAILEIGGEADKATCESWNGSSWTEVGDLNTGRYDTAAGGPYTSAIVAGGSDATSPGYQSVTETWNGSSWTETGDLNTARQAIAGDGTTTAMIVAGGTTGSNVAVSETFNGSTWTEVSDLNTARHFFSGAGSTTDVIVMGGNPRSGKTENYDGSSWSEVNDMATARDENLGRAGTGTTALMSGGNGNPGGTNIATTEEWSFSGIDPSTTPAAEYADAIVGDFYYNSTTGQFKNIFTGVGSWASGTNTPDNRSLYVGMGTATASLMVTGSSATAIVDLNTSYNGTAWTELGDVNLGRTSASGFGTSTAGLITGGYDGAVPAPSAYKTNVEEWDGSSWTEVTNQPEMQTESGSAGSQTAGLIFGGGNNPGLTAKTKSYDGTNWTEVNALNAAKNRSMGYSIGTQTAAMIAGGDTGSITNQVEQWDGSSWTETTEINTARFLSAGSGSQTSSVIAGGRQGSNRYTNTELWDGTSWTEVNDLATSRSYNVGAGTGDGSSANSSNQLYAAGVSGPSSTANTTATEEWNIPDFQIKTVTTS